jgi:hypothetical protein
MRCAAALALAAGPVLAVMDINDKGPATDHAVRVAWDNHEPGSSQRRIVSKPFR